MAKHSPRFLQLVNDAKSRIQELSIADVKTRLDRGEKFTLVDVREDHEWAAGHLPQAVHLGKGILERDAETRFPDPQAEIVLYCGGGYRSALAADALQKMGYTNVWSLDGGFRGWKDAGHPIEQG
jgi:rhodanese-related sulfurtransferase